MDTTGCAARLPVDKVLKYTRSTESAGPGILIPHKHHHIIELDGSDRLSREKQRLLALKHHLLHMNIMNQGLQHTVQTRETHI